MQDYIDDFSESCLSLIYGNSPADFFGSLVLFFLIPTDYINYFVGGCLTDKASI